MRGAAGGWAGPMGGAGMASARAGWSRVEDFHADLYSEFCRICLRPKLVTAAPADAASR